MKRLNRKKMRRSVSVIGMLIVALIAACVIVAYFAFGANLRQVNVSDYIMTAKIGERYEFRLDTERMIWELHLPVPPENEIGSYPEVAAIRSLDVAVTQNETGYHFETISTSTDANFSQLLRKAGVVLKNTQWDWTENDIIGSRATQPSDGFTEITLADYVTVSQKADGSYSATLNRDALLAACAFDLPLDPTQHSGYNAIMSLSVGVSPTDGGYRLQTQSTMTTIMETLAENHIRIVHPSWTWTAEEMAAHTGAAAEAPLDPVAEQPQEQPPEDTPVTTAPPSGATNAQSAITSLYGFDQTAVRVAIRDAKKAYYGSKFQSGSVLMNLFAVGNATTPHKNCFRIVYDITTTEGAEYLIADVYDLFEESGYTAGDVTLKTVTTRADARSTSDLKDYTIYTLNGGSMVFAENASRSPFDENGLVMAKSISEPLTYAELWDIPQTSEYTLLQLLNFARNEMFARAGHQFPDGSYLRHFSSYDWYEPTGEKISLTDLAAKWPVAGTNTSTIRFIENLIVEG